MCFSPCVSALDPGYLLLAAVVDCEGLLVACIVVCVCVCVCV